MSLTPLWRELISAWKERMMARQRGRCILCNGTFMPYSRRDREHPLRASVEHLVPLSKGGTNDDENLGLSHSRCNNARGNNSVAPFVNDIVIYGDIRLVSELRRLMREKVLLASRNREDVTISPPFLPSTFAPAKVAQALSTPQRGQGLGLYGALAHRVCALWRFYSLAQHSRRVTQALCSALDKFRQFVIGHAHIESIRIRVDRVALLPHTQGSGFDPGRGERSGGLFGELHGLANSRPFKWHEDAAIRKRCALTMLPAGQYTHCAVILERLTAAIYWHIVDYRNLADCDYIVMADDIRRAATAFWAVIRKSKIAHDLGSLNLGFERRYLGREVFDTRGGCVVVLVVLQVSLGIFKLGFRIAQIRVDLSSRSHMLGRWAITFAALVDDIPYFSVAHFPISLANSPAGGVGSCIATVDIGYSVTGHNATCYFIQ